jgi:hypothetical protein
MLLIAATAVAIVALLAVRSPGALVLPLVLISRHRCGAAT